MSIRVISSERYLNLWFPSWLIFNRLTAAIAAKAISENANIAVPAETFRAIFKGLRDIKQDFRGLTLVDVKAADGTIVEIRI